jgi:hypothetical protein
VVKKANRDIWIGMGFEELVKLCYITPDTAMGVRLEPWVEGAKIETYRNHAP